VKEMKKYLRTIIQMTMQISAFTVLFGSDALAQKVQKPASAQFYYKSGLAKANSNRCFDAIDDFDKAIELNPLDAGFYKERSKCLSSDKAIEDLNKAIELKPDFAEAYFERGQLYFKQFEMDGNSVEDREKALSDFNKAIDLNPKNADFYYSRAMLYFHYLKDNEKAFRDFDEAVRANPRNNEYLMSRAMHYQIIGEYQKAISDCTAILRLKPRNFDAFSQRGFSYFYLGEYQKAINNFNMAEKVKPQYAWQVFEKRAKAYRAIGKIREAEADEKRYERFIKEK
jgi:tetratricopeptide (TPR) repeat protein